MPSGIMGLTMPSGIMGLTMPSGIINLASFYVLVQYALSRT